LDTINFSSRLGGDVIVVSCREALMIKPEVYINAELPYSIIKGPKKIYLKKFFEKLTAYKHV
jgi:hypothetical protein